MTSAELAARIDHTILKPEATLSEVRRIVGEAREYHFASVCVAPRWVSEVAAGLAGSGVLTCTVVGFPHGTSKAAIKGIEAISAIKDGAQEIDVVAHLPPLIAADFAAVKSELLEVAKAARAANPHVVIKVIVESALLSESAIAAACRAVRESGCDFIKTSTGFHPAGGASVAAVTAMKKYAEGIKVKASGGIRDWATAKAMLDAGADRLGMSSSVAVIKELT
jgi:deoxyribose-phosphate aldolase